MNDLQMASACLATVILAVAIYAIWDYLSMENDDSEWDNEMTYLP